MNKRTLILLVIISFQTNFAKASYLCSAFCIKKLGSFKEISVNEKTLFSEIYDFNRHIEKDPLDTSESLAMAYKSSGSMDDAYKVIKTDCDKFGGVLVQFLNNDTNRTFTLNFDQNPKNFCSKTE